MSHLLRLATAVVLLLAATSALESASTSSAANAEIDVPNRNVKISRRWGMVLRQDTFPLERRSPGLFANFIVISPDLIEAPTLRYCVVPHLCPV